MIERERLKLYGHKMRMSLDRIPKIFDNSEDWREKKSWTTRVKDGKSNIEKR